MHQESIFSMARPSPFLSYTHIYLLGLRTNCGFHCSTFSHLLCCRVVGLCAALDDESVHKFVVHPE
jgi:hypothetical protein